MLTYENYGEGPYGQGPYGESYSVPDDPAPPPPAESQPPVSIPPAGIDCRIDVSQGIGQMTFEKADNILNNIYLSLMITKGSWFFDPDFGMRTRPGIKNLNRYAALLVEDVKDALQWIIDLGRAVKFDITTERDKLMDIHRLKLKVEATQSDGRVVTFETFMEVV